MGERINLIVKNSIAPIMKINGYKKSGLTFLKHTEKFIFLINFQQSSGNSSESERFYINCGIYSAEFAETIGEQPLSNPKEYDCHVRYRYERITNSAKEYFELDDTTDLQKVAEEVIKEIEKVIVFFNSITEIELFLPHVILSDNNLLKYYLIRCRYEDVEKCLAIQKNMFGSEDRWKGMREQLIEICSEYSYSSTILNDI